jgi:glycosyltransferase involved in cell wall biosynthesis
MIGSYKVAIQNAKGKFVCFLEADDIFFEDSIEAKIRVFAKNSNVALVFSKPKMFGQDSAIVAEKERNITRHYKGINMP